MLVRVTDGDFSRIVQTDAYGRYQFLDLPPGAYAVAFEDDNFIFDVDEDPYPDEGLLYQNQINPQLVPVVEGDKIEFRCNSQLRINDYSQQYHNG